MQVQSNMIKPMGWLESLLYFGSATVVIWLATRLGIPFLVNYTGMPSIIAWFIMSGVFVFVPLFITALLGYRAEGHPWKWRSFKPRFRLFAMSKDDWVWTFGAILVIAAAMGLIVFTAEKLAVLTGWFTPIHTSPSFFEYHGIENGQYWILLVWLPMFFFNILGEEFLWRGYILPRQEAAFGNKAWIVNAFFWLLFHTCFGLGMMIMLIPMLLIQCYVTWKRKNTWISILIHGIINGPAFVAISLKLL